MWRFIGLNMDERNFLIDGVNVWVFRGNVLRKNILKLKTLLIIGHSLFLFTPLPMVKTPSSSLLANFPGAFTVSMCQLDAVTSA